MLTQTRPSLKTIALLFILSFLVTAVFSVSLKTFFASETWLEVLGKGLVIPCFTWTVQLILTAVYLRGARRMIYWKQLGIVCLIGSAALLPSAFYNLVVAEPSPLVAVVNVLASVALMSWQLYRRVKSLGFNVLWAVSWVALIVINMSLYLYSIGR